MGHFQILESARICVLEYKRKPIEMTEFQWVPRNYRIDSGATRNRTGDTRILESARLPVIKNTDKKLVCLLSVLYELKIFLLLTGIFYLSSFSGFQPWAFSSNSCPSRVIKAQPSSGLVICPMRRIPSICETFSWSAIGTVKRSS